MDENNDGGSDEDESYQECKNDLLKCQTVKDFSSPSL